MLMLDCLKNWVACALVALLLVGCGSDQEETPRRIGPNATALQFVSALKDVDPQALSKLSAPPLSDLYIALDDVRVGYAELREWLMDRYEGSTSSRLETSAAQWRLPMTMFGDLKLEGLIEGTRTETSASYRIHYRKKGLRRCSEDLVVEKRDGVWLVVSYGHDTPPEYLIGQIKGQATKLRFTMAPGKTAVKRLSPATLAEAIELFWQQAPK
jgi:hypothetical protein